VPTITYLLPDGRESVVDAPAGVSVMKAAVANDVPGIVAECGGQAMCATCHVYVDPAQAAVLGEVSEDEDEMLDCTAAPRLDDSRLSCQLVMGDGLEQLTVRVPDQQV
jgi:2Fe-2S ferredoxin